MQAARTVLYSGAFALQAFCGNLFAEGHKLGVKEALHLRKITEYWKEGHLEDAKTQLKTYLSNYPSSVYLNEVQAMLGDLYLQEGQIEQALDCYQKIQSKECQELTALHRAEALYQLGRYEELVQWAETKRELLFSQERIHLLLADSYYRKALKETDPTAVQENAKKAIDEFQLVKTLDKEWGLVIAYLHSLRGETAKAADLYLSLSKDFTDKKDQLYLQAAFLLEHEDVNKAISLFHEIATQSGNLQKDAATNELILLFREKRYAEYLQREQEASSVIAEGLPSLSYYTGLAHFEQGEFEKAVPYLQQFANSSPSSEDLRTTLRSLFSCGHKTQNSDLIKTNLDLWQKQLPLDQDYLDGLWACATVYLGNENYSSAKEALREIVERFPSHPLAHNALWDYSQTLLCLNELDSAKKILQTFAANYPESPHLANAWQNLIFISTELLKSVEQIDRDLLNRDLAGYLEKALQCTSSFDEELLRTYHLHLAHLLFDIGELRQAASTAETYLNLYPAHESAREVRFIQITCAMNLELPVSSLIDPLQKALENEPDPNVQAQLHLQLFNANISESSPDKALAHLVEVYKNGSLQIKSENLLWLAEQIHLQNDLTLAKEIYCKAIAENNSLEPLIYEEAVIRLKNLHMDEGDFQAALSLLLELHRRQKLHPEIHWRHHIKTQFEIAELQESLGNFDEALSACDALIGDDPFSNVSYYHRAALLKKTRLQLLLLPSSEKYEGSPQLLSILDSFKDLQIARNVESEPVHLEAALEYAIARCSLLPEDARAKRMIFYLQRIEEDFLLDGSDIASLYLKERELWPEKNQLIEQYLKYIAAERKRLKSKEAEKGGDTERSVALKNNAKEELQALLSELNSSSPLLYNRVASSLAALD